MAIALAPQQFRPRIRAPFERSLRGELIVPGDKRYESARWTHNYAFDRRPAAIVRPADASDVARTVRLAAEAGVELAIKGGGHSMAGHSTVDGGIVLDMSGLRGLHIDADRGLAWAQPGLTAGDVTRAAGEQGLAVPFGDVATVGIAGLTLGGGIGYLIRKHGMAIDNLVSVDIVTADGRERRANADENPELFWAVRGGGGNFGVVTRFQYRLQPVGNVVAGGLFLPATREVISGMLEISAAASRDLSVIAFVMKAPPAPFMPADRVGKPVVFITLVNASDDIDAGMAAVAPFRALATPIVDMIGPMPYPAIYNFTSEAGKPAPETVRSLFADELAPTEIDKILARVEESTATMMGAVQFRPLGGAMADVADDATAFAHRNRNLLITAIAAFQDPAEFPVHDAWAAAVLADLRPQAKGVYVNFVGNEGEARVREAYPDATLARLGEVKRRYDPSNVFHLNQNVRPSA
jgi:FAD/FMN-containing dehydrogenase